MQRNGRQIAAPTIHLFRISIFWRFYFRFSFYKMSKTLYIDVGVVLRAAKQNPPRFCSRGDLGFVVYSTGGVHRSLLPPPEEPLSGAGVMTKGVSSKVLEAA